MTWLSPYYDMYNVIYKVYFFGNHVIYEFYIFGKILKIYE